MQVYSAVALSVILLAGSGPALAQHPGSAGKPADTIPVDRQTPESVAVPVGLSYNYAELSYADVDLDDTSIGLQRYRLAGSFLVIPSVFVTGGYTFERSDSFDFGGANDSLEISTINLGLGYRLGLSETVDFKAELGALRQEFEFDDLKDDDTGFQLGVGLRAAVSPRFELAGDATYVDVFEDDDTIISASGLFHVSKIFAVSLDLESASESQSYGLTGRLNF
jgi:hypothetical protein